MITEQDLYKMIAKIEASKSCEHEQWHLVICEVCKETTSCDVCVYNPRCYCAADD